MKLSERLLNHKEEYENANGFCSETPDVCVEAAKLLDECETLIDAMRQEIQNLGGSLEGIITADELLSRLRAQEKADG